jgi:hypothetical protein
MFLLARIIHRLPVCSHELIKGYRCRDRYRNRKGFEYDNDYDSEYDMNQRTEGGTLTPACTLRAELRIHYIVRVSFVKPLFLCNIFITGTKERSLRLHYPHIPLNPPFPKGTGVWT